MAYKGKNTCRILKDIRRQIAEANDIDLVIKECTYQGDCSGTCPRCEAEVAYLERELARRESMGKAVRVVGLAAASFAAAACSTKPQQVATDEDDELEGLIISETQDADSCALREAESDEWMAGGKKIDPEKLAPKQKSKKKQNAEATEEETVMLMGEEITEGIAPRQEVCTLPEEEEEVEGGAPFVVVEEMPQFIGGDEALLAYLKENIHYPEDAEGAEGRAIVTFIVQKDGSIADVTVVRSSGHLSLDREAVRVIESMPAWKPGKQRGKPVNVKYTAPVSFKLQ